MQVSADAYALQHFVLFLTEKQLNFLNETSRVIANLICTIVCYFTELLCGHVSA
jgi:hypothetical protein